jgi:hypothetical protein
LLVVGNEILEEDCVTLLELVAVVALEELLDVVIAD